MAATITTTKPIGPIWECFGRTGMALVQAQRRENAARTCREWLGWDSVIVLRRNEERQTFIDNGGSHQYPVVYSNDQGQTFTRITERFNAAA